VKNICIIFIIALFAVSSAFAVDFAPTLLKLSAPSAIQYNFDGSALNIPVKVTGSPSSTLFLVYTKDKASSIININNGYLGWHTVNKVDTCIYAAQPMLLDMGTSNITWNGKDQDGKNVEKGEYTYYLFGYDSVNSKVFASPLTMNQMGVNVGYVTRDHLGNKLPRPLLVGSATNPVDSEGVAIEGGGNGNAEGYKVRSKWTLGNDPADTGLFETTQYTGFMEQATFTPSPTEADWWFQFTTDNNLLAHMRKWKWVPNGDSERDTEWGDSGEFVYSINTGADWWMTLQEMRYVGGDLLAGTQTDHSGVSTESELVMVSASEGEEMFRVDLSEWWVLLADAEAGGQAASGPNKMDVVGDNVLLGAHSTCANQMINPTAGEKEEDWNRWVNANGDYTGDHNFEEDSEKPWVCHDYNVGPYKYQIQADRNLFSAFPCFDMGAVSFGLYGPDGTGLSYHAYSGETAGGKQATNFIDDDTPYDGIYTDNVSTDSAWGGPGGHWFIGQDSVKGVIAYELVSVENDAPAAFSVAQNSPNPFNPTTTISFTNTEAGNVSIDVFNVAGQKVDTIADQFMSAGNHSVTWNASEFSAGVYFYAVKTGDFSRTMKMTLLK